MPSFVFSIPGKTFIAGEYAVLKGSPALVVATPVPSAGGEETPSSFELHASPVQALKGQVQGIHAASPAGLFVSQHAEFFAKYDLNFRDPFGGGGLGASTAQFLAVYALHQWQGDVARASHPWDSSLLSPQPLLAAYLACAWAGEGIPPSGVDLWAQALGGLSFLDKTSFQAVTHPWPFADLSFFLVHTGVKLATHEHLKSVLAFDESGLIVAFAQIQRAFRGAEKDPRILFVDGINAYAAALEAQGLTAAHSLKLLNELRSLPGVLAVKACGAMGSDVLFVVTNAPASAAEQATLSQSFVDLNLKLLATEKSLTTGLRVRVLEGNAS